MAADERVTAAAKAAQTSATTAHATKNGVPEKIGTRRAA